MTVSGEAVHITGVYSTGETSVCEELAERLESVGVAYGTINLDWLALRSRSPSASLTPHPCPDQISGCHPALPLPSHGDVRLVGRDPTSGDRTRQAASLRPGVEWGLIDAAVNGVGMEALAQTIVGRCNRRYRHPTWYIRAGRRGEHSRWRRDIQVNCARTHYRLCSN